MVLNFGKKQSHDSFKTRVARFWDQYAKVADQFYETIEAGECASLLPHVNKMMSSNLPGMSWVFGPGIGGGHSFTVTGEGDVAKQLLADYWYACAPEIPKWSFHASRQPTPADQLREYSIDVGEDGSVDVASFQISTSVDEEEERININAWHPAFDIIDEEHHFALLFLLLDEALGEFGTQSWLGEINVERIPECERRIGLAELPKFIDEVSNYHKWEKLPPLRSCSVYELREHRDSPRADTVVGSSVIPTYVFDLIDNDGKLKENPLEGTGAEFAYIAFDSSVLPNGQEAHTRGNLEDALDDALEQALSGRALGGAFGLNESYIDLLLLDGDKSRKIVQETLGAMQLGGCPRIESFV